MNENESEDPEDIEFSGILNRLTSIVQEQYRKTLSKAIQENYNNWSSLEYGTVKSPAPNYIEKWTEMFEEKAVKSCMIAQFYRKEMLKFVSINSFKLSEIINSLLLAESNQGSNQERPTLVI